MKILYGLFITILLVFFSINIQANQTSISTSFAIKTYAAKDSMKTCMAKDSTKAKKKNLKVKKIKRVFKAIDKGIGPIKTVKLGKINKKLVEQGKSLFFTKCFACHQLDARVVGPPLRKITKTVSPEYFMNLLLNTTNMQKKNVRLKKMIKEYNGILMPPQSLSKKQARALLEYFRSVVKKN